MHDEMAALRAAHEERLRLIMGSERRSAHAHLDGAAAGQLQQLQQRWQHEQQQATRKVMGATVAVVDTADMVTEQQWWGCAGRVAYS